MRPSAPVATAIDVVKDAASEAKQIERLRLGKVVLEIVIRRNDDGSATLDTAVDEALPQRNLEFFMASILYELCGKDWDRAYQLGIIATAKCLSSRFPNGDFLLSIPLMKVKTKKEEKKRGKTN